MSKVLLILVPCILIGIYPVFALEMESERYRLQLEPSEINPIPQTRFETSVDEPEEEIRAGEINTNSSSSINYKWIAVVLTGLLMIYLIIWYFKQPKAKPKKPKTKPKIRKKQNGN